MRPASSPALDDRDKQSIDHGTPPSGLLAALQRRERAAQERTYREHRATLETLAQSILSCPQEARSLVADVFTDFLYKYVDGIKDEPAIPAYLRMMTVRRSRRQNVRRGLEEDVAQHETTLPAVNADVIDTIDANAWMASLGECLSSLTEKARQLLRLHFGHELSFAEIGGQVGTSKQAVGKTVNKSLAALRRCLETKRARRGRAPGVP